MIDKAKLIETLVKEGKLLGVLIILICGALAYVYNDQKVSGEQLIDELRKSQNSYIELIKDGHTVEKEITKILVKVEAALCDLRRHLENECEKKRSRQWFLWVFN